MLRTFPIQGVETATIREVAGPGAAYVFAINGDPHRKIFCHRNQAYDVAVNPSGFILAYRRLCEPGVDAAGEFVPNAPIVFVRESQDPKDNKYTRAMIWTTALRWKSVEWAVNARKRYRVVGVNHRTNGVPNKEQPEIEYANGTLIEIMKIYPRVTGDGIAPTIRQTAGRLELTADIIWYNEHGTEVADPRPRNVTI